MKAYAQTDDLPYKPPQVFDQIRLVLQIPDRHGTTSTRIGHPRLNRDCLSGYALLV